MRVLQKIPTDCRTIDKFLDGGISFESISLIYGEAETGKTTLAMQLAVKCAEQRYKTLFVDSDGTFSARRLSQIASGEFKKTAELIMLMKPNNFHEQMQVVDRFTDYVTKNVGLVVIDTITSLYSLRIAESPGKTFELNRELNRQLAILAQAAKTHKIAVLITSQVRSVFDETYFGVEPVARRVLKFWCDTIIAMRPTEKPRVIKAILEKTSKMAGVEPVTCYLKIAETGIHDYSMH
jgi:DNA repair protein RadB